MFFHRFKVAALLAGGILLSAAIAQADAPPPAQNGVTAYPASFFAGANLNTAMEMIARLPGFAFDEGQSLRGYAGAAGNVLIDGQRPATKSDGLRDILGRIPASSVERIELIRGGAPGIDMEGRTVLANIVRKKGPATDLTTLIAPKLSDNRRLFPSMRINGSQRDGQRSVDFGFTLYDQWDDDSGKGADRIAMVPASESTLAAAKIDNVDRGYLLHLGAQTPAWGGVLEIAGAFNENDFLENEQDHVVQSDATNRLDQTFQKDIQGQNEISLSYTHPIGDKIEAKTVFVQSANLERYRSAQVQDFDTYDFYQLTRTGETILRQTLTLKQSDSLSFETGGEGVYNFLNGGSDYRVDGVYTPLPSAYVRVNEKRGEVFLSSTWKPLATLSIEAGTRLEASQISVGGGTSNSFFYAKPRIVTAWSVLSGTQVRVRFEHELGQLNFADYVASTNLSTSIINAGNPNLRPEQRWVSEIGAEQHVNGDGAIVATFTHQALTDVVDVVPVQGVNAPGNIGSGTRDIVALTVTEPLAPVGLPGGSFKANQTWTFSSVTDPTTGAERSISGDKPSVGVFSVVNDMPKLKSSWTLRLNSGFRQTYYRIDQVQTLAFATSMDAIWEYKPKKGVSILVQVQNLNSRDRRRTQDFYTGLRGQSSIDEHEAFSVHYPPVFSMRLRKTW